MAKVLLADDDLDFTKMISHQFKKAEIEVDFANKRDEVFYLLETNTYNVILLDVFFPNRENGLNLLTELHDHPRSKDTPILLISGLTLELFQEEANVDQYLAIAQELISKSEGSGHIVQRVQQILIGK